MNKVFIFILATTFLLPRNITAMEPHNPYSKEDVQEIKKLIESGANIYITNKHGQTMMHAAAACGCEDIINLLLKHNADANIVDKDGLTPLHMAACKGHEEVVNLLLASGADANLKDNDNWSPLHMTAYKGYEEIINLLLTYGANAEAKNDFGQTPLHLAAYNNKIRIIQQLLAETIMPNAHITTIFPNDQTNKKVLKFKKSTLINKKQILSIIPNIDDLLQQRLQSMKSLIETPSYLNITALDTAKIEKSIDSLLIMQSIINAQSLQDLPKEIRDLTEDSIIRELLAKKEKFA